MKPKMLSILFVCLSFALLSSCFDKAAYLERQLDVTVNRLSYALAPFVWNFDDQGVEILIGFEMADKNLLGIIVYYPNGESMIFYTREGIVEYSGERYSALKEKSWRSAKRDILIGGTDSVGIVEIFMTDSYIDEFIFPNIGSSGD